MSLFIINHIYIILILFIFKINDFTYLSDQESVNIHNNVIFGHLFLLLFAIGRAKAISTFMNIKTKFDFEGQIIFGFINNLP